MCKYCDDGCVDLITVDTNLKLNGVPMNKIQTSVYVTDDQRLKLFMDDINCEEVCQRAITIKFCPMCGRNLQEHDDLAAAIYTVEKLVNKMNVVAELNPDQQDYHEALAIVLKKAKENTK